MVPEASRNSPREQHDDSPDVPPGDAEGREGEPPGYDTSKRDYTGISAGALDAPDDLAAARDFAEMVVDTVREGLLILDFGLCVKAANESFYQQFGVRPAETVGRLVYDLGDGQWDLPELRRLLEEVLPHDKVFNDYEVEHAFEGLGRRVMLLNARRLNDHQLILLAIEDVTERRRSDLALRRSEARFRSAFDIDTVGAIFWGSDMTIREANGAFLRMTGFEREEALGLSWQELTPEEFHPSSEHAVAELTELGEATPYEKEYFRKDGSRWWGLFAARRLGDEEAVEFVLDITERKLAEEGLRESEARFRQLAEAVPDIVFTTTLDGVVDYVSPRREEVTGQPPENALGTRMWPDLIHPDDRPQAEAEREAAYAERRPFESRYRLRMKSGEYCWFIARARPVPDGEGGVAR